MFNENRSAESLTKDEIEKVDVELKLHHEDDVLTREYELSCLCCIYERIRETISPVHQQDLLLSPRKFHRTCSRTFSYHKGKMRCVKRLLLTLCFLLAFLSCTYMLEKNIKIRGVYLNLSRVTDSVARSRLKVQLARQRNIPMNYPKRQNKKPSLGNPFNPNNWNNKTANTRKHYVILYWSKIRGHKARLQKKGEYIKNQHIWPYTYVGDKCPVSCELTNDRSRAKDADAFVVHSRLTDVWDFPPFEYLAPWILQNNENPVYTPALMDPRIMSKFNLLISYRLDSDFPSPIYPMPSLSKPIPFKQRLGGVLAVFSKCEVVRTEYMRQLMKYIDVHSYGACLKNREGLIGLYGQVNGKYVFKDYKLVLTRFYKFSLVFMNQDCDFFVDDRLYHALETGSIPVYMGTDKIDEFLPGNLKNSIIRVSDFNSPKELAEYLNYLNNNETAFNEYLKWKEIGLGDISNTTIGRWWQQKYPLFCQVCMRLSQGNLHRGLDVDTCKPRTYLDWKLYPPYGVDSVQLGVKEEPEKPTLKFYIFLTALVLGIVLLVISGVKIVLKVKVVA